MRFDDIDILQAIDRHEEAAHGAEVRALDGRMLMEELAGQVVADAVVHNGFAKEIHTLRDGGLLTFKVWHRPGGVAPTPDGNAYYYLQQVNSFALTIAGRDRARGRVVLQPVPSSAEDDDRLIPHRVLAMVAEAIEQEHPPAQQGLFLQESGVPALGRPLLPDETLVLTTLSSLLEKGSEGRRILRTFLGSWLSDCLATGPAEQLRDDLVGQLARHGWFVEDDRLVCGEPVRPARAGQAKRPVERWQRLSQRGAAQTDEPLITDVPDWLYPQLQAWLYEALEGGTPPVKVLRPGSESPNTRLIGLRLRTSSQPWLIPAHDPALIDAIDATLRWIDLPRPRTGQAGLPDALDDILSAANSIWRVSADRRCLERRIDPAITAVVMAVIQTAGAEASGHLTIAWDAAYGRHPDPDKAYDEAVLAVEALACPLVCPKDPRRSLGTVIRDLRAQAATWKLAIGDSNGPPAAPERFIGMLEILWQGQSRHGGSPNSRSQTQLEAEGAVHLAATTVQYFSAGLLTRT